MGFEHGDRDGQNGMVFFSIGDGWTRSRETFPFQDDITGTTLRN